MIELNFKTKDIALQAMIATSYIVVTFSFQGVSFMAEQFRLSEFLLILVIFSKKNSVGIVLGTLISNMLSPVGVVDVIVGTGATALSCYLMDVIKVRWISYLIPAIVNGVIIGIMLHVVFTLPLIASMISVFVSELVVTFVLWTLVGDVILKNTQLQEIFS